MAVRLEIADAVVVGGGLAGVGAALACAAAGLNTVLVERRAVLGWEATWACQLGFLGGKSDATQALLQVLQNAGAWCCGRADAPVLEMALNRAVLASGVRQRNYWTLEQVGWHEERLAGLRFTSRGQLYELRARVFVDAADDLRLWQMSGGALQPGEGLFRAALFFNGLERQPLQHVQELDLDGLVILQPGLWPGELAVYHHLRQADTLSALERLPHMLDRLRGELGWLRQGLVTHISLESFPLFPRVRTVGAHPWAGNLLPVDLQEEDALNTVGKRLDCGAQVGRQALESLAESQTLTAGSLQWCDPAPEVERSAQVLVCGGGTAGCLAALAAARQGARTTLVEAGSHLGGMGANAVHTYYWGVEGGLQDEVDARTEALTPLLAGEGKVYGFHPVAKKIALAQLLQEAGVELLMNSTVTGVDVSPRCGAPAQSVQAVHITGEGKRSRFHAQVVIDSSGDGDVAALAGACLSMGRQSDGLTHPYSLVCARLDAAGRLTYSNIDSGYVDASDAFDLVRARQVALQQYWQDSVNQQNRWLAISPLVGARSSRHITGRRSVTLADEVEGRQFDDVIAYARSHYDNHAWDYENESDEAVLWVWLMGNWSRDIGCEVPYGALLPADLDGLLVACRALAVTYDAHHQLRMQRDMQRVGEAAGLAAALCARLGFTPHNLPVELVQDLLIQSGALGAAGGQGKDRLHNPACLPPRSQPIPTGQWGQALGSADPGMLVWHIYRAGDEANAVLDGLAEDDNAWTRWWAAVLLALRGRANAAALHTLVDALRRRVNLERTGYRPLQLWIGAAVLLGRVGSPAAADALCEVLQDDAASLQARVAALRALGRIGHPRAAAAVESMLARLDIPIFMPMRPDRHPGFGEDARWRVHLCAAQTLACLGSARADLVRQYLGDERAHVRRYAQRVMDQIAKVR